MDNTSPYIDFSSIAASGISALGQIYGAHLSAKTQKNAINEVNKQNREMADLAWNRNLEMWERQNVYNSPTEQMKRLKDAGLNPHLVYGNSANVGNASNLPHYEAPNVERYTYNGDFGVGAATQQVANSLLVSSQLAKNRSEIDVNESRKRNIDNDSDLKSLQYAFDEMRNSKTEIESEYWRDFINANLNNVLARTRETNSSAQSKEIENEYLDKIFQQKVSLITTQALQADYNFRNLSPLQKNLYQSQISNLVQQTLYTQSKNEYQKLLNHAESVLQSEGINLHSDAFERSLIQIFDQLLQDPQVGTYVKAGAGAVGKVVNLLKTLFK